jgi:hypothetical protein
MENALLAYRDGRDDGYAGRRDAARAEDPETGADYRIGFLDGRIDVFRMMAAVRAMLEEAD